MGVRELLERGLRGGVLLERLGELARDIDFPRLRVVLEFDRERVAGVHARSVPDFAIEPDIVDARVPHRRRPERVGADRDAHRNAHGTQLLAGVEGQCDHAPAAASLEPRLEPHEPGLPTSARFERAVRMSIGMGKTMVELFAEPISSSVCR